MKPKLTANLPGAYEAPSLTEGHITDLVADDINANAGTARGLDMVQNSLQEYGAGRSILLDRNGRIIAGNKTIEAAGIAGMEDILVIETDGTKLIAHKRLDLDLDDPRARELAIADNRSGQLGLDWDTEALKELAEDGVDLSKFWYEDELAELMEDDEKLSGPSDNSPREKGDLSAQFGVDPFSVLNAQTGYWQERKAYWMEQGIKGELGRAERLTLVRGSGREDLDDTSSNILACGPKGGGTSVFDPVLCELAYRWFSPPAGVVLDPFAGGSVRGIVAAALGRMYVGVDLSEQQIAANRFQHIEWSQAREEGEMGAASWIAGDSRKIKQLCPDVEADFIWTCPPYGNLERYSDDPSDLSGLHYEPFIHEYRKIIKDACSLLKPDRFAAIVVGDFRDKKTGAYQGFVSDTIEAFEDAGLMLYNEAILMTMIASAAMRTGRQFAGSRKLGKIHQNVLVFCKGDPKRATAACGDVECGDMASAMVGDEEQIGDE
jgi:hypothetical protein